VDKTRHSLQSPYVTPVNGTLLPSYLNDFAGSWQLSRTIMQSGGDTFLFTGKAIFSWHGSDMHYKESGLVRAPNGSTMPAERTYIWQQGERNSFHVLFDDKRYFHTFSATNLNAEHLCGEDHYVVNYAFNQWPIWTSTWQVKGPRKNYELCSCYQRG
jgi:hypothetical protein